MNTPVIDSHCHLDMPAFAADHDAVVARARAAGVTHIVVPGVRPGQWPGLTALGARYPEVRVAIGIHPHVVAELQPGEHAQLADLPDWLARSRAVAVGECGLDGPSGDQAGQERLLRAQIAVAREQRLPLIVHVLRAHDRALRILAEERAGEVGGVLHSYSGGAGLVAPYRDLGFAFSFAGPVTYANARRPLEAARAVPPDLLLAETDAPDQAPVPHRGSRSEPAYVTHVIAALAAARGEPVDTVARATAANARRLLSLGDEPVAKAT